MMKQALVAIGGEARRLRLGGIEVPISKSFLIYQGKPLLYWSLSMLQKAGVTKVILAGNRQEQIDCAKEVLNDLPFKFEEALFFKDEGKGFHALPYFTAHLLDDSFFLECGHAIMPASHYREMMKMKEKDNVVFSAYYSHFNNPRLPITLVGSQVSLPSEGVRTGMALATPLLVDRSYAALLPSHDYNIKRVIQFHASRPTLRAIFTDMPPEFDIPEEYSSVLSAYDGLIMNL